MKKYKMFFIIFLLLAIICFSVAGYAYLEYRNLWVTLKYYGTPDSFIYNDEGLKQTLRNFYWGIAKFVSLGVVSFIASIYFLFKKVE